MDAREVNGRDSNGRFAAGNPGGPGRPPRETEEAYLEAVWDVVGLDEWKAVVVRALADAQGGNAKARDWLSGFLIPKALLVRLEDRAQQEEKLEALARPLAVMSDEDSEEMAKILRRISQRQRPVMQAGDSPKPHRVL